MCVAPSIAPVIPARRERGSALASNWAGTQGKLSRADWSLGFEPRKERPLMWLIETGHARRHPTRAVTAAQTFRVLNRHRACSDVSGSRPTSAPSLRSSPGRDDRTRIEGDAAPTAVIARSSLARATLAPPRTAFPGSARRGAPSRYPGSRWPYGFAHVPHAESRA